MSAEPFQYKGRIETTFGDRNRAAVAAVAQHDITSIPENAVRSEEARTLPQLYRGDFSMKRDSFGRVWVEHTRTDPTPEEGQDPSVMLERWNIYLSLPRARYGTYTHIVLPYSRGGSERSLRERAAKLVSANIDRLQSGKISREELEEMNAANLEELFRLRYMTTTIPGRQRTAQLLDRATKPDSLDRVNNSASRVIENTARLQIMEDLVLDDTKHDNAQEQVDKMDAVSDYIEGVMEYAASRAAVVSAEKVGTHAFTTDSNALRTELYTLLSPDRGVIVTQPYLGVVTGIRHALFAKGDPDDLIKLMQHMSIEDAIRISKTPHIPYIHLDPRGRQKLLYNIARELRKCISDARKTRFEGPEKKPTLPRRSGSRTYLERQWDWIDANTS